jgi:ubiquinone/menaquinone biosynthesis C-methylase UbiE
MAAMESKTRHGAQVVEQFTRQAWGYAEMTEKYGSGYDPIDLIDVGPEDIVLDVACGTGRLTLPLAATARHVTGFDITPAMVDIARKAQVEAGVANIDWRIGNVHALPFADDSFSLVTCGLAAHHFTEPATVLAEMRRVCRPGGRIAVMDLTPTADKAEALDRFEKLRDASHVHALTPEELRGLGRDLGLTEVTAHTFLTPSAPVDVILSWPISETHSIDELREMILADPDALGVAVRDVDGAPHIAYLMSVVVWRV